MLTAYSTVMEGKNMDKLLESNKAFVGTILAIATAVLPQVQDAVNAWVTTAVGAVVTFAGVWLARNKPYTGDL